MNGVVILESFTIITETIKSFSVQSAVAAGTVGVFIGLAICLGVSLKTKIEPSRPFVGMFAMFVAIGSGYLGGNILPEKTPSKYETHYKVELTEELDYKEFVEKYEVIDFEDGIYTIRERLK